MAQNDPTLIPWSLMAAVLSGQASETEVQELQAWRLEATENETRYRKAERLWAMTGKIGPEARFDSQADWPKVAKMARISAEKTTPVIRPFWRQRTFLRVAAVVLLIALGALLRWGTRGPQVEWQEVLAENAVEEVRLPDGSLVSLREGSSLRYPTPFLPDQRQVYLSGEGWFEVEKDASRPFRIKGPSLQVQVLGTSFAVRDLPTEATAQVDVATGLVQVVAQDSLLLPAGKSGQLKQGRLTEIPQNPYFLAWRERSLRFEETHLSEVVPALSRYYGQDIRLETEDIPTQLKLTARFEEEPLADVLNILQITLEVEIDTTNSFILIRPY
ncbi:MAG: FecR domain-containing protein [Bacteroidota bacterium]